MTQMMTEPDPTRSRPAAPAIPAGWYADPQGSAQRRWWNGSAWTHALEPLEPEAPAPAQSAAPWENLPGPSARTPVQSPSAYGSPARNAPTVLRALPADTSDSDTAAADGAVSFPTRRQLREAEAEAARAAEFAASMGMGGESAQTPAASAPALPAVPESPVAARTVPARAPLPPLPEETPRESAVFAMGPATPAGGQQLAAAQPASVRSEPAQSEPAQPAAVQPTAVPPTTTQPASAADLVEPAVSRPRPARPTVSADVAAALHFGAAPQSAPDAALPTPAGAVPTIATAPADGRSPLDVLGPITPSPSTLSLSTRAYTAQVWMIVALPVVVLAAAWGLVTLAPEQYTLSTQAGLVGLLLLGTLGLALRDRRELAAAHHSRTASPLWGLLTPLAYLVARALSTKRETGRGWAPVLALLAVGAAIAAAAYFTPLALAPLLPF